MKNLLCLLLITCLTSNLHAQSVSYKEEIVSFDTDEIVSDSTFTVRWNVEFNQEEKKYSIKQIYDDGTETEFLIKKNPDNDQRRNVYQIIKCFDSDGNENNLYKEIMFEKQ